MKSRAGTAALVTLLVATLLAGATAQSASTPCAPDAFVQSVAAVPNLQTSATLLSQVLGSIGAPNNSAVFLPTDAAWSTFKQQNGASAPDLNRTAAILLYNSIVGYGKANRATLVSASPVQTSAGNLQTFYTGQTVSLPLTFNTTSSSSAGSTETVTGLNGETATLGQSYDFCNERVYTVDRVLLPAKTYASTPTTYLADIAAIAAAAANGSNAPRAPPPPSTGSGSTAGQPTPSPSSGESPSSAPAPAPSGAAAAATSAVALACGLAGAALLLAA